MVYLVPARKYVNNTLVNIETLKLPAISGDNLQSYNWYNSDYPDYKYGDVTSYLGASGFTLFYKNSFITSMSEPERLYDGPYGCKDIFNNAIMGQTVKYEIITSDDVNRSIVLRFGEVVNETNRKSYQITFDYCIDDEVIVSIPGYFPAGRSYSYIAQSDNTIGAIAIPWLTRSNLKIAAVGIGEEIKIQGSPDNEFEKYMIGPRIQYYDGSYLTSFRDWLSGYTPEPVEDPDNPYSEGGVTGETDDTPGIDDSTGNFSDDSDNPEADELPTISAVDTGFATIFTPSRQQLRALSGLFWNSNVFTFLQNLVENITDMFVSLAMVPFTVASGATVSVTWLGIDTAVSLTLAAKQFYEFNMGTIDMASDSRIFTSGSALDYSPFSQLGIYLPFIGYRELDIDECRGASVNLRYRIDILSGACVAIIKVGGRDIYEFTGNCLTQIPITNENMQSLVSDAVNVGVALVGSQAAATAASADMAAAEGAGTSEIADAKKAHAQAHLTQSRGQLASATANASMGMKPAFAKTGSVSGADAMLAVKQPYLFLRTPRQAIPAHYQRYCGFPSNITGKLNEFSGYTVVEDIRLNDLVATSPEIAEIYSLLKKGVII